MDDLTPRRQALLDFIMVYMMSHAGRAPTYTEILAAKVGRFTKAGPITSKSVIRYNLQKLEDAGHIRLLIEKKSRIIEIPGGTFGVPWNRIHNIPLEKYPTRVVGVDSHKGQFQEEAKEIFYSWWLRTDVSVYSFSLRKFSTNLWDELGYAAAHMHYDAAYKIFADLVFNYEIKPGDIAVVTDDHFERLAAVGFGMAIFGIDEVLNGTE